MSDIRIRREHDLGLQAAREVAADWAEQCRTQFDMQCTLLPGESSDTVEFRRSGVNGRLVVAADHFDLDAKLGFLLGAFSKTIEREIRDNLDKQLARHAGGASRA
ncbi:polyhydroxyalkanoic acid synthase [Rubrivivax gelatinosus]|uniref:Polyhydroxyalkanoic acid synthase n=1 Tax=Rubrivivax gelatinosus TaxID=28068 RepID=A0ABS1DWV1_RUBGE|nr:polyhydroxyalkanoic acid synthase [Rubrivivax gelatinosus]MBK1714492.1 polyhydroxyalkanoic acid synthase [Rubrivivax gelatinosus]